MSAVRYNNKRLIPAPFVGISKEYQKSGQQKIGSLFTFNIQGKLLPCVGSPTSSGTFFDDSLYHTDGTSTTRPTKYPPSEDPCCTATDNTLSSLLVKETAVRELFAQEGKKFEIEGGDAATSNSVGLYPLTPSGSLYCFPRINNISFSEGQWVNTVDYSITLECDEVFGLRGTQRDGNAFGGAGEEDAYRTKGPLTTSSSAAASGVGDYFVDGVGNKLYLENATEDWALEFNETPQTVESHHTFRLTHNVSAVGKRAYDEGGLISAPWEQAQRWVKPRLGLDNTFVHSTSGINLNNEMIGYNHTRSENTDELAGSYTVSETWIISSGNAFEEFSIDINTDKETSKTTVGVQGLVTGLDTRRASDFKITESKWDAAEAKFAAISTGGLSSTIFTRVQHYSGITDMNSSPTSSTIGKNPVAGTISYNYSYDDRPGNCVSGAISESIVIQDTHPHDVFASIPCIGRSQGPVLQDIGTITESTRSVSVDVTMPFASGAKICPKIKGSEESGGPCTGASSLDNTDCTTTVDYLMGASPKTSVDEIMDAFELNLRLNYTQVFTNANTESWDPWNGKYTRNKGWTFQNC